MGRRAAILAFAVLAGAKSGKDIEGVRILAERIRAALRITLDDADPPITTGASIGVALFPADGDTRETLLRAADKAMYKAKNSGRDCILFAQEVGED